MVAIPFPLSSSPGIKASENGGRLINAYAEQLGDKARDPVVWRRVPGLVQKANPAQTHARGFMPVSGTVLAAYNGQLCTVDSTFTVTALGTLLGTKPVTFARNNKTPTPDICCVTENGAFTCTTSGAPVAFADANLPIPNSVCAHDGYFIWTIGDGRIFASNLNSNVVPALSFTTAASRPGSLLRGVSYAKRFWAFKANCIEVYTDVGTTPFPLAFETMIPRGIAGTFAVAGWEEGWSNTLIWVADDGVVYRLQGYTPVPVSTLDVNRAIASIDATQLEASVYMHGGHAIWVLTSPGNWTWEFNLTTGQWNERQSYVVPYWRGSQSVNAYGMWLVGDRASGAIFQVSETTYSEGANPLVYQVISGQAASFPYRIEIPRADFDFVPGTGLAAGTVPTQTDPVVLISFSNDGGVSWSNPYIRHLGTQGLSQTRISLLRQGLTGALGRQYRLIVADPVHVGLLGATMDADPRGT